MSKATIGRCFIVVMMLGCVSAWGDPIGTAFTYQGRLDRAGEPVSDGCDFVFRLWDSEVDGNQIGSAVSVDALDVVDGLFTVELDFGDAAFGARRGQLRVDQQGRVAEEHPAPVFHRAGGEVGHRDQVELGQRVLGTEIFI